MVSRDLVLKLVLVVTIPIVHALAQVSPVRGEDSDARWESLSQPYSLDRRVFVVMEFGEDLIVGGEFNAAGGVVLNHIGRWDGTEWHPLGAGFNYSVRCLGVYQGELIAGGNFTESGGRPMMHVARWNGLEWEAMGEGFNASPTSFAEWNGGLAAGGWFASTGNDSDSVWNLTYAAWWDGMTWVPLGGDRYQSALSAPPRDLAVYRGSLYAAGSFSCLDCPMGSPTQPQLMARWDGSAWIPTGPRIYTRLGMGKPVGECFALWESLLVVGGNFSRLDSTEAGGVITFDGEAWYPLGAGVESWKPGVLDLEVHQGRLYAVGYLLDSPLAEWDGISWKFLTSGPYPIRGLASHKGLLYAAGEFSYSEEIAAWNGTEWLDLPTQRGNSLISRPIPSLVSYGDRVLAQNWDGTWVDVDDLLRSSSVGRGIHDFHGAQTAWDYWSYPSTEFRGDLIIGLHTWDGVTVGTLPDPPCRYPTALTCFEDKLIAGSAFFSCTSCNVAAWDGQVWTPFAEGLCPQKVEWSEWGIIKDLTSYQDQLIAGGFFSFNLDAGQNLAAWNGQDWIPLGEACPNDMVTCLIVYHDDLIAGGFFNQTGQVAASYIARWDGAEWYPMGQGTNGPVYDLVIYNDRLIVGGDFDQAGGNPAGHVGAWDGVGWIPLGSGVDCEVLTMVSNQGNLWVGGEFSRAGGKTSFHLARWVEGPRTPTISNFTALRLEDGVHIQVAASYLPFDHQGFLVYRESPGEDRVSVTTAAIQGEQFSMTDTSPPLGAATYRIAGLSSTGAVTLYASTKVPADPNLRLLFLPPQPNPSHAETRITFHNAKEGQIRVSLYDVRGRFVVDVLDSSVPPGSHSVIWNGRDSSGRVVAPGAYFSRLTGPEGTRVQRLIRSAP